MSNIYYYPYFTKPCFSFPLTEEQKWLKKKVEEFNFKQFQKALKEFSNFVKEGEISEFEKNNKINYAVWDY